MDHQELKAEIGKRLKKWSAERGEREEDALMGNFLEWAVAVAEATGLTPREAIAHQVEHQAERRGVSVEEALDFLFNSQDSGTFMRRLQLS